MCYFKQSTITILFLALFSLLTPKAFAGIDFTASSFSAQEDSGSISISANLAVECFGECYDTISIDYSVSGGTATSGTDFTPVSGQLSWNTNGTQSFQIPLVADSNIESNETIIVTLDNCRESRNAGRFAEPGNPTTCNSFEFTLSPINATANIINDDFFTPGNIRISGSTANVVEGETATITVIRSGGSDGAVSIDYATANITALSGSDYTSNSGALSWADGESGSKTVEVMTHRDIANESNETFTLALSNPTVDGLLGVLDSAVVTIQNVDTPGTVSFDANSLTVQEGSQVTATVTRSNGNYGAVSVDFSTTNDSAVAGEDYTAASGTLNWTNGESGSKTIRLTTRSDVANESNETFTLTLSNPSGKVLLGTLDNASVVIQNVDTPGTISFDKNSLVIQEGGQVTVTVTRNNGSHGVVSIDYGTADANAVAGDDYTAASGTLNWADNEFGSKSITIETLKDVAIEQNESFRVSLSNLIGEATLGTESTATITIANTTKALTNLPGLNPDQRAVTIALDGLCEGATGDLHQRCQDIYNSGLDDDQLVEVIDSIKPTQVATQGTTAINFGFQQLQVLHGRIGNLRQNTGSANRISLADFTMSAFGQQVPIGQIAQALIYNALDNTSGDEPLRDSPLGLFIKGQIDIGDKDSTQSEQGFEVNAKSITLGLDYQFTDQLVLGIAGGYGHNDTHIENNGGELETHSGNFSSYGSYFLPKDFYINWALSYSINDYDNSRNISNPRFQATATSNHSGDQYGGSLGLGKDFYIKELFVSPYTQIEYLRTGIDEYAEHGGRGLAFRIAEQSIYSLTSTVGGQISNAFSMPWGVISPGMRFEWRHQFKDNQRTIKSQVIDARAGTGSFSIGTDDPDRDYFNLGASLAITLPKEHSAFIRYETRLGHNDIKNHTIEAAIRISF